MGIRETINQHPKQTTAATAAIVVLAILFIMWQACSSGPGGGAITTKAFFTTDDGKTWFIDESSNIPPFQKDGKMAVRAQVYTCDGKNKFVGYLEMYAPQDKAMLEQLQKNAAGKGAAPAGYVGYTGQPMVKRPGEPAQNWLPLTPQTSQFYQMVVQQPKCPGGGSSENVSRVFPE